MNTNAYFSTPVEHRLRNCVGTALLTGLLAACGGGQSASPDAQSTDTTPVGASASDMMNTATPAPGPAGTPATPTEPAAPGEPVEPVEPAEPGEPGEPAEPVEPGEPADPGEPSTPKDTTPGTGDEPTTQPTTRIDASRLLQQATFGPTAELVDAVSARGVRRFVVDQFEQPVSRYKYTLNANRYREEIHTKAKQDFCGQFARGTNARDNCWRDWESSQPVEWDFFAQAVSGADQLRQRVAFTLSQIFVTSGKKLDATYGFAHYHQMLRDNAFGNYRDLLRSVTLSPFMGKYLDLVNNAGEDPNENYAREMLQLFSLGTCLLNPNGTLQSGKCVATYDNEIVRNYAYALSGWTYPVGGVNPWCDKCDDWVNPTYYRGEMVAVPGQHDKQSRQLLSNIATPAGRTPQQALDSVLDSLMAHQNLAPFVSRQLIQFLVTSNPSPAYVGRVSAAFSGGRYSDGAGNIGSGVRGDLKATIAAILLDDEARDAKTAARADFGRLREPVLYMTGTLRALDGKTDGVKLANYGGWHIRMGQHVFNAPSVFNFYPPSFPLNGTELVAPQFGINNTNTVLARINFANALIYWWYNKGQGAEPDDSVPGATGTKVSYARFESGLADAQGDAINVAATLNDLLADGRIGQTELQSIAEAMSAWSDKQSNWLGNADNNSSWQREQVRTAAYLILASPHYQVQR